MIRSIVVHTLTVQRCRSSGSRQILFISHPSTIMHWRPSDINPNTSNRINHVLCVAKAAYAQNTNPKIPYYIWIKYIDIRVLLVLCLCLCWGEDVCILTRRAHNISGQVGGQCLLFFATSSMFIESREWFWYSTQHSGNMHGRPSPKPQNLTRSTAPNSKQREKFVYFRYYNPILVSFEGANFVFFLSAPEAWHTTRQICRLRSTTQRRKTWGQWKQWGGSYK